MRELIESFDWSRTPLGPRETWPQSLRTSVGLMLATGFPMYIAWGPEYIQLYNDAYRPILGSTKHPGALGDSTRHTFREIWDLIGPMFDRVMAEGVASTFTDQLLLLDRNGYVEECYFHFSYSAIPAEQGRVGGVLVTVAETTERVIGERHLRTLRDLGEAAAIARTIEDACASAFAVLGANPHDLPFASLYLLNSERTEARLAGRAGLAPGHPAAPDRLVLEDGALWPLRRAIGGERVVVDCDPSVHGELPGGTWPEPSHRAVVLPVAGSGEEGAIGVLVAGVSPRLDLGPAYLRFLDLVSGHLATALGNARAYELERRRAEALAQLDQAKTMFFSNVSHEFRTPLTLQLGPLEDALGDSTHLLEGPNRERIELAHRNALRLLKLVNTLLDFSRIEAGRADAVYYPTDLATLTRDLASSFRSAFERAGVALVVDCAPLPEPILVDRDMWEKIVLNLVSNAFKFTLQGQVAVNLRWEERGAVLEVRDTGVGIPPGELPHVFERFRRVRGQQGRSHEGTGIGLALVQELVHLHGGEISVSSAVEEGTTFRVFLPAGRDHLPAERIGAGRRLDSTGTGATPYVEEAMRWLPGSPDQEGDLGPDAGAAPGDRLDVAGPVYVVDDNADMREYIVKLLSPHFPVRSFPRADLALHAMPEERPALVLSDVMLPGMDGFAFLSAIRESPLFHLVPVLLLSARAGEEARVEGLSAGADDYLVKPFVARELLARVRAHLAMDRVRRGAAARESELRQVAETERQRLVDLINQAPASMLVLKGPDHVIELVNGISAQVIGRPPDQLVGKPLVVAVPELVGQPYPALLDRVYRTGIPHADREARLLLDREHTGQLTEFFYDYVYQPLRNLEGQVEGILIHGVEVTERVMARRQIEASEAQLQLVTDTMPGLVSYLDRDLRYRFVNSAYRTWFGIDPASMIGRHPAEVFGAAAFEERRPLLERALGGETLTFGTVLEHPGDRRRYLNVGLTPDRGPDGQVRGIIQLSVDLTEQHAAEDALRRSEERYRLVARATREAIWDWDLAADRIEWNEGITQLFGYRPGDVEPGSAWRRSRVHPDDRDGFDRGIAVLLASGAVHWQEEYRFLRRDGTWARVSDRAYVIHAADGKPLRVLGTISDITRQRETEEQLRQVQRIQAVGRLAGGIAHEVNNQMTVVLGFGNFALRQLAGHPAEGDLQQVLRAGTRAATITQQLLAFSRQQVLQPMVLELNQVIRDLGPLFQQLLGADLRLTLSLSPSTGRVRVDRSQLEQVLVNLALNARDAMPNGGELRISTERLQDDRAGEEAATALAVIRVQDTGVGMDAEIASRAFEPFFTTKPVGQGTGLGLSMVYGIITQSGGRVELASRPGHGTTVSVYLPVSSGIEGLEEAGPGETPPTRGERILVVEDEEMVRQITERALADAGYRVLGASSAEVALELLGTDGAGIDLVLTDLVMPGMNGRLLAERIAEQWPSLPVLFMSGHAGGEMVERGLLPAGGTLLQKPFTPQELTRQVKETLRQIIR